MDNVVGITATVPVEILYAGGAKPVDLNNIFITSKDPVKLVSSAEVAGFAHNICTWIKGIYSVVLEKGIKRVIAVMGGDCSNTVALGEVLEKRGIQVIPFEYPLVPDRKALLSEMDKLRSHFSASWEQIEAQKLRLDRIRSKLRVLDRLTYKENVVTGFENHLFLVNSSDFEGNPDEYESRLDSFLAEAKERIPRDHEEVRIGYLGVPPIFDGFYQFIETLGARVVFNEVQRQFSMPFFDEEDVVGQYLRYTYPYAASARVQDIKEAAQMRHLDGLIHYTQTFCYRQIYDIILREELSLPILTLEGDRPGKIDSRTAFRIETFIEMIRGMET